MKRLKFGLNSSSRICSQVFWPICGNNSRDLTGRKCFLGKRWRLRNIYTSRKRKARPQRLEVVSFPRGYFQVPAVSFRECLSFQNRHRGFRKSEIFPLRSSEILPRKSFIGKDFNRGAHFLVEQMVWGPSVQKKNAKQIQ